MNLYDFREAVEKIAFRFEEAGTDLETVEVKVGIDRPVNIGDFDFAVVETEDGTVQIQLT